MKHPLPLSALAALILVQGCFTVPVTTTVVTQPGRRVTAEATKFNVLWVSPSPTETASLLIEDLLAQCDGADLTGVTLSTQVGWVIIGQQEKTMASGYCVE
jgi:hypothetical protein